MTEGRPSNLKSVQPFMIGVHARNGFSKPPACVRIESRDGCFRVTPVLLPGLRSLEHQRHLRPGIAQPIWRDPGDVLKILRVPGVALVRPTSVGVRREGDVQDPWRPRVAAYPDWLSGRTSANRASNGRNQPSSTFQGVHRSPRNSRNASASLDRIETSMSSCSRRTPVKASMLHPPMTHHGRSNPAMNAAMVAGFQWVPPAVPAVEFLGRQVTDRGRLCCRRLSRWQHENGTLQQKPLPESRHALSGISAHGAHAHPSGPLRYLCWSSGRRSRVPTGSRVERLRAVPNRRRARCPSCSVRGGY